MSVMPLNDLAIFLRERLRQPLPGPDAHEPLRATPTGLIKPRFDHPDPPRPGSVLILLYEKAGGIYFPLIKRPDYLGAHSGQVSLPGGKSEPGETPTETALREAYEEIGVDPRHVDVVGILSPFFVIPSNFIVTPIVGYLGQPLPFVPDHKEVERILNANLNRLLAEDAVQERDIIASRIFPMRAPHFLVENEVVWGATAMMLNELRMVVREVSRV
jgi:8-oxo-dGTP pyrophosphatase MutT (NUDIX family)